MLGQHKHEEKKLRDSGAKGMAAVLEVNQSSFTVTRGNPLVDHDGGDGGAVQGRPARGHCRAVRAQKLRIFGE
ncbi:MAG TPA: hypothetical protein VG294_00960 [Solirubrobacteraceae bacterium]|nr:hypothetical protein [Solirubrobacteraceae bacterium]